MIRFIYLSILSFFFVSVIHAQEKEPTWAIKHSPQHFIFNTLRLEIEKMVVPNNVSITLAPFYILGDSWEDHPKDDISGVGGELAARVYFIKNNKSLKGFYASYGFNYTHFNNVVRKMDWRPVEEDGLEFLKYGDVRRRVSINRYGVIFLIGYQLNIRNTLILDFYHGLGLKKAYSHEGDFALKHYDNHFLDHGYSGLDPRMGVKIGFVLK